jgi:catechol 2,3-dioxygenase-like lactoylglutathione lyase family enzyme
MERIKADITRADCWYEEAHMRLDHTIVPAKNKDETARFFIDILGFEPGDDLADARFVHVNDTLTLRCDEKYSNHVHLAFYVSDDELAQVIKRAQAAGTPYGSRARSDDNQLGQYGGGPRLYFSDPGGNSIELVTIPTLRH